MKLKSIFETVYMDNEYIAVPVGEGSNSVKGVLKLNESGKEIFDLLVNGTSKEDIIELLSAKYDNNKNILERYVDNFFNVLINANLIVNEREN